MWFFFHLSSQVLVVPQDFQERGVSQALQGLQDPQRQPVPASQNQTTVRPWTAHYESNSTPTPAKSLYLLLYIPVIIARCFILM